MIDVAASLPQCPECKSRDLINNIRTHEVSCTCGWVLKPSERELSLSIFKSDEAKLRDIAKQIRAIAKGQLRKGRTDLADRGAILARSAVTMAVLVGERDDQGGR